MIDPRTLRTFLVVCREGSISGAARALNVAQPSISVAMTQFERSLGERLFARGRQGITLTPAGHALRRRAEQIDSLLRDAEEAARLAASGVRGPLRVGGTPGALVSLVPAAIERMGGSEHLSLQIMERSDAALTDLLRRGEIEVAVVTTGIGRPPSDIEEQSIARDPFALIVGRAHDALGPRVSLRDLDRMSWVLPQAAGAFHRQIEALFIAAEVPFPLHVISCDSLLTSKDIVRRTARVTVLPRGVVAAELSMGLLRALPIVDADITRSIGIRTARGAVTSDLATEFIRAVRSVGP